MMVLPSIIFCAVLPSNARWLTCTIWFTAINCIDRTSMTAHKQRSAWWWESSIYMIATSLFSDHRICLRCLNYSIFREIVYVKGRYELMNMGYIFYKNYPIVKSELILIQYTVPSALLNRCRAENQMLMYINNCILLQDIEATELPLLYLLKCFTFVALKLRKIY